MKPLDIAVVGYGTAGQAAALCLGRDGHRVQVFERAPAPGPVGAGLLLQPSGLQALWQIGLLAPALRMGRIVRRLYGDLEDGRPVMDMRYAGLDARLFGVGIQRGALFTLLHEAAASVCTLQAGREVDAVDAHSGHVRSADGRSEGPFDLVIAADGASSRLRAQLGRTRVDQPYPWGALWCLVPERDWAHPDQLRQRYRGARMMSGMLPVGRRADDPVPRLSFFWSLPVALFAHWRSRPLAEWRDEVSALWPEIAPWVQTIERAEQLATASYRDSVLADQWHRGRLVAMGDAAHAMSPQLGQGVNMALLDALALRDALRAAGTLDQRLSAYAHARRSHVGIYQFWSRWLTPLFQSDSRVAAGLRDLALHPLGRLPGGRGNMLQVLAGTRRGWFGRLPLAPEFIETLDRLGQGATADPAS